MTKQFKTEEEFLENYKEEIKKYEKSSVTTDNLIFALGEIEAKSYRNTPEKELKVLLIKRNDYPYKGQWALAGGFLDMNESLWECANRELEEETGLNNIYSEQLHTYGDVDRDPRYRIISTVYMSLINQIKTLKAGTDASDARWFTLKTEEETSKERIETSDGYNVETIVNITLKDEDIELSAKIKSTKVVQGTNIYREMNVVESEGIAFDHAKIIYYGLYRLRSKLEYTGIVFNLLPEKFTLNELQKVFELILNKKFTKANFQRKTKKYVSDTGEVLSGVGYNPPKLFKFNTDWEEEEI